MSELPTEAAPTSCFAHYILDCVVEALDEVVDPLIVFYKVLKRAVLSFTVFIARYHLGGQ